MVVYYVRACEPACMRYRSGDINYLYGYIYKRMFVFATANNVVSFLEDLFLACNLWT